MKNIHHSSAFLNFTSPVGGCYTLFGSTAFARRAWRGGAPHSLMMSEAY